MDSLSATTARTRLRSVLLDSVAYAVPGVYDGLGARIAQSAGFPVIHATGAGISCSYGYPDLGLITMTEMLQRLREICTAVDVPVIADADTGYGNAVNVRRSVQEFEKVGAAGIHIEDQKSPKKCGQLAGKQVEETGEMVQKIRAAVAARSDGDFVIIARTDARESQGLEEVIARCHAYLEAGADAVFPMALESEAEVVRLGKEVPGPKMITATHGGKTPPLALEQFAELGYKLVVYAMSPTLAVARTLRDAMNAIREDGSDARIGQQMLSFRELYEMVDIGLYEDWDRRFAN